MRFDGKRVLVTGAARGIGNAIASRFLEEGAFVVRIDLEFEAARIRKTVDKEVCLRGDATSAQSVKQFVAVAVEQFGGLDIVINNVGVSTRGTIETTQEADWDRMSLNTKSIYLVSRSAIPHMRKGGGGVIVNIGSSGGIRGIPNIAAYGTAKAGVVYLTRLMAMDHATDSIRVNCVSPGLIDTDNLRRYAEAYASKHRVSVKTTLKRALQHYPLRRLGKPIDIANAVLFLCSDEASWITGENLNVDGGHNAGTYEVGI